MMEPDSEEFHERCSGLIRLGYRMERVGELITSTDLYYARAGEIY